MASKSTKQKEIRVSCGDWVLIEMATQEPPIKGWIVHGYTLYKEKDLPKNVLLELTPVEKQAYTPATFMEVEKDRILAGDLFEYVKVYDVKADKTRVIPIALMVDIYPLPITFEIEDAKAIADLALDTRDKAWFMQAAKFIKCRSVDPSCCSFDDSTIYTTTFVKDFNFTKEYHRGEQQQ